MVRTLLDAGWHVEAEGKLYGSPATSEVEVTSGIDWFELHGTVEFGDTTRQACPSCWPRCSAARTSSSSDDGTFGMLPEEWLKKYGVAGRPGHCRGRQPALQPQPGRPAGRPAGRRSPRPPATRRSSRRATSCAVSRASSRPTPPAGFVGELRGYQREGLGWLHFLQQFRLRRLPGRRHGAGQDRPGAGAARIPPRAARAVKRAQIGPVRRWWSCRRSLIFNWKQEAARFTPAAARARPHRHRTRQPGDCHFDEYDLVLTTYGTLRRDIVDLKDVAFDYCILDEAQAIKNASTESAKAVRLLRGSHRLALSGTPVENHLGELWSLFEFLNPGMLGSASVLAAGRRWHADPERGDTRACSPGRCGPSSCAAPRSRWPRTCRRSWSRRSTASWSRRSASSTTSCATTIGKSLLTAIERDGMNKSKIRSWRRCCACARPPATRA